MRLITWNINSVRLRLPQLLRLLDEHRPDVMCLQETKCPDDAFPHDTLKTHGYTAHFHGMKAYNGVAILTRTPLTQPMIFNRAGKTDCRHIAATINGLTIHNLYIPAGGDIPDPDLNDKFAHKLAFLKDLKKFLTCTHTPQQKIILCGDFNIAPHEHDVWSHRQLINVVSHTPIEVQKIAALQQTLGFIDTARHFIPMTEKSYSWWSYRNHDWQASNRGRRLDHIWVTPALKNCLSDYQVLAATRNWAQPSDHAPVMVRLKD